MPRPKSFDPDLALDRAVELFQRRGYEATSIAELEEHLGLGRQSIYNEFGDKHALYLKALERYRARAGEDWYRPLFAADAGLGTIRTLFLDMIAAIAPEGGGAARTSCLVANSALEMGARCADTRAMCQGAEAAAEKGFRQALGNAVKAGDVRKDVSVDAAAAMLVTQMYGLSVMARMGAPSATMRRAVEAMLAGLQ